VLGKGEVNLHSHASLLRNKRESAVVILEIEGRSPVDGAVLGNGAACAIRIHEVASGRVEVEV
jgi:hypothetical protein